MKRLLTAAAVPLALVAAPAAATGPVRASAPTEQASEMGGGLPLSAIIVLLTVLGGAIYLVTKGDDDPDSP
jgi:hypothetical protein